MKARIVINLRRVSFELNAGQEILGEMTLLSIDNDMYFEWIPNQTTKLVDSELTADQLRIIIRLCEISEIIRSTDSMKVVSFRFLLRDSSRLPLFKFYQTPHILTSHLLQFLEYKKYFKVSSHAPNSYMCELKYTPAPNLFLAGSFLTPQQAIAYSTHKTILRGIMNVENEISIGNGVTLEDCSHLISEDGSILDMKTIKCLVMQRGLSEEARRLLWPFLLGIYDPSDNFEAQKKKREQNQKEYEFLRKQWSSLLDVQIEKTKTIGDLIRVIENDVKRTDRTLHQFKGDGHPNLSLLTHVLTAFALLNQDTGYVQGMGDLVAPFIITYIESWSDDTPHMYGNIADTRIGAESFIFSLFVGLMHVTHHDRMFTDLAVRQEFAMERAMVIVQDIHKPIYNWLNQYELTNLLFLYRPYLLLFKREFSSDVFYRIWDQMLCFEQPYAFPRLFLVSILFQLFPKLLLQTNGSLGDVMSLTDKTIGSLDPLQTLQLTSLLKTKVDSAGQRLHIVYDPLPEETRYREYTPKKLKFAV